MLHYFMQIGETKFKINASLQLLGELRPHCPMTPSLSSFLPIKWWFRPLMCWIGSNHTNGGSLMSIAGVWIESKQIEKSFSFEYITNVESYLKFK